MAGLFSGAGLTCLRGERLVFTGLRFEVAASGALVLTGPNGSGKSSLLRLMAGLLRPWRGRLAWDGQPVTDDVEAHRARLVYVGHQDAVKPVLTVAENLAFWARLAGTGGAVDAAQSALARLGLGPLATLPGRYLSSGQKRRLNLARLLVSPAKLWLLDEPTVGLDRAAITRLELALAEHRADGGMVVLSTHAGLDLPGAGTVQLDDFAVPIGGDEE
ncbi:MAG: heme ABC exporter ATP-binding protein CcmA [Azospirillum sp.]|nr:heme ABC exporter ATP-binding protein CcmA [Azospirillum sp.]